MSRLSDTKIEALIHYLALYPAQCCEELAWRERDDPFPCIPTVYLLCWSDKIQYAGQTSSLHSRIQNHLKNPKMQREPWDRIYWFQPGIRSEATRLEVETSLIVTARPPLNKTVFLTIDNQARLRQGRFTKYKRKRQRFDRPASCRA